MTDKPKISGTCIQLIPNWRQVLKRAWSVWCIYLAGALEILPYIVPYLDEWIPRWLSIVVLLVAPIARILEQRNVDAGK